MSALRLSPLRLLVLVVCVCAGAIATTRAHAADAVPRAAEAHRRDLVRNAHAVWGLQAPVATFAAQIHQESAWNPSARSPFASGLAQFTPDTADWISRSYAAELGANQPLNPSWALRALVRYDRWLWDRIQAATSCDRMAMTLSAYNGGLGWVQRDRDLARARAADPARWWSNVEKFSSRSAAAMKENRDYPRRILLSIEPRYVSWGSGTGCEVKA